MQNGSEREAARAAPPEQGQGVGHWDASRAASSYCNVASATAARGAVVLHMGVTREGGRAAGETGVELLHRVAMSPLTAKHLHQLLSRLIAEHGARPGAPR